MQPSYPIPLDYTNLLPQNSIVSIDLRSPDGGSAPFIVEAGPQ
jgi:hypothetical protein